MLVTGTCCVNLGACADCVVAQRHGLCLTGCSMSVVYMYSPGAYRSLSTSSPGAQPQPSSAVCCWVKITLPSYTAVTHRRQIWASSAFGLDCSQAFEQDLALPMCCRNSHEHNAAVLKGGRGGGHSIGTRSDNELTTSSPTGTKPRLRRAQGPA